jgi:hypothetical protein
VNDNDSKVDLRDTRRIRKSFRLKNTSEEPTMKNMKLRNMLRETM